MKQSLLLTLILSSFLFACKKGTIENPPPVQPTSEFSRSLFFPNQNGFTKFAYYNEASNHEAKATITEGKLWLIFNAAPKTNNSGGDAIAFTIDASHVNNGLVKDYDYVNSDARILSTRYTYTFKDDQGDIWGSIVDLGIGPRFEGVLHIQKHDPEKGLVSGAYDIYAKSLISDPTKKSIGSPIDPVNYCDLHVKGSFKNVKIE